VAFHCDIVTPDSEAFSETVQGVVLPAHDGLVGILTGRAPMLVKLGTGTFKADLPGGREKKLHISGGVAQMKDNKLTVLTESAQDTDAPTETA
jgi:F-type H+-transporting ATPase subunit epsilon